MFVCAGESEQFDFAKPIGIGLIDAAISLTRLCISSQPEEIVFVGSAGSYGEIALLQIIESCRATNVENSLFNAAAYSPIEHKVSCETLTDAPIVNSSNYITTDSSLASYYLARNIHLENMEFYAVAKVADAFGIPFRGIFCVTNYCDAEAHESFLKYHPKAMEKLTDYIEKERL